MTPISGRFYRIIFESDLARVLDRVPNPEGRFHHDRQPALYLSPSHNAARVAIDSYYRSNDAARVIVPLKLSGANILDFREVATSDRLGLMGGETTVHWRRERRAKKPATSWRASDAARAAGADGMIYHSRKAPPLWHIVLFAWNQKGAPTLAQDGLPQQFISEQTS